VSGRTVALIPARGGSKRFPGKNVHPFNGRPLAAWTLDFSRTCGLFDDVYLNTDMAVVEALVQEGIRFCPRPPELAHDKATLLDVIRYTCRSEGLDGDDILALLPVTGPLRTKHEMKAGLDAFRDSGGDRTVVSVNISPYPAGMLWTMGGDSVMKPLFVDSYQTTQKQRHQATYQFNDLFVIDSVKGFLNPERNLFGDEPRAVEIPPERSMPIDYEHQLFLAEALYRKGIEDGYFT